MSAMVKIFENVNECNGKKYFHKVKDEIFHSTRRQPS